MSLDLWLVVGLSFTTLPLVILLVVTVSQIIIETVAENREVDHLEFKEQVDQDAMVAITFLCMTAVSFGIVMTVVIAIFKLISEI